MKASCIGVLRIAAYESNVNKPYRAVFHKKFFLGKYLLVENIIFAKEISFGGIKIASAFLPS